MAPVKPLKTYSRTPSHVDSLFELKLRKRNVFKPKRKIVMKVKELQETKGTLLQLSDSSFHVKVNNTFDRLLKTENCQPVTFKDTVRHFTSDSDVSKSKSGLPSILLSTTVHSPLIRKKRGRKKKKNVVKVKLEDVDVHKIGTLDQSVHSSLEIVKCNFSSLYRPNNITYNGSKTVNGSFLEQHSENISFDAPKICSTPMDIAPVDRYKKKSEIGSPVSTRNKYVIPFVCLDEQLEMGVANNNISSNKSENFMNDEKLLVKSMSSVDESKLYVNRRRGSRRLQEMDTTPSREQKKCSESRKNLRDDKKHVELPLRELVVNVTRLDESHRRRRGRPKTLPHSKVTKTNFEERKVNEKENIKLFQRELFVNITKLNIDQETCKPESQSQSEVEDTNSAELELDNTKSVMCSPLKEQNYLCPIGEQSCLSPEFANFKHSTPLTSRYETTSVKTEDLSDLVTGSFTNSTTTVAGNSKKEHSPLSNTSVSIESSRGEIGQPLDIYITLRNRQLIKSKFSRKKYSRGSVKQERSSSDLFSSDNSDIKISDNDLNKPNLSDIISISDSSVPCVVKREVEENLEVIHEKSEGNSVEDSDCFIVPVINVKTPVKKAAQLKPGKLWRRSLSLFRRSMMQSEISCITEHRESLGFPCGCVKCKLRRFSARRLSVRIVPIFSAERKDLDMGGVEKSFALQNIQGYVSTAPAEEDKVLEEAVRELSLNISNSLVLPNSPPPLTARDIVLRKCGQTEPLPFTECYPNTSLQHCHKIGEGVYGEVFLKRNVNGGTSVMKVIPIEGTLIVNGDRQKKFEEILSEIIIATAVSDLRYNRCNQTSCFNEVQNVKCVQGQYPSRLLELWELYDEDRGSENDSPEVFSDDQLFVVLELMNGGKDLESFVFTNAQQCYALFGQVACALAVAENALSFEHRDLHWGNILISNCDREKNVTFVLDGKEIVVPTCGVEACIIDFTLSRITHDGVVVYNDLSHDEELFTAEGDYQFEIYRLMQEKNGNEWQHFEAYTNVLWLHYVLDKMVSGVRYGNTTTKTHKSHLAKLRDLKKKIIGFESVSKLVTTLFV